MTNHEGDQQSSAGAHSGTCASVCCNVKPSHALLQRACRTTMGVGSMRAGSGIHPPELAALAAVGVVVLSGRLLLTSACATKVGQDEAP